MRNAEPNVIQMCPVHDHLVTPNVNKPITVEQAEPSNMEVRNYFDPPLVELFCIIMNKLEMCDLFAMRRVSRNWLAEIKSMPKECLKLNVKKATELDELRCLRSWEPNASIRRMQFEFVYKEPVIVFSYSSNKAKISVWDRAFSPDLIETLGRNFSHLKTLIIYWDADDSEGNIDNLVLLLSQQFNELVNFGLIVSGKMANSSSLPKIFAAINTHMPPLSQLHLFVPSRIERINPHNQKTLGWHGSVELNRAVIESVTNLSMTCVNPSVVSILSSIVPRLADSSCTGLDTLTIHDTVLKSTKNELGDIKDKFASVKRLQIIGVITRKNVKHILNGFPNVEQLHLTLCRSSEKIFDFAWIRTLQRLPKLNELTLLNFNLAYLTKDIAKRLNEDFISLDQVQKLTIATHDLLYQLRMLTKPPYLPGLKPYHIAHTIREQFPALRELNLWSGDCHFHEKEDSTWQNEEQNISRELPLCLPQLPELRGNIQLRHQTMYQDHLVTVPAEVRQTLLNTLMESDATRAIVCSKVLCYALKLQPDHRDCFTALLNGNLVPENLDGVRQLKENYRIVKYLHDSQPDLFNAFE